MGSCCATVKPTNLLYTSKLSLNSVREVKLPEENETIPEDRVIVRGSYSTDKEKPGQEKTLFTIRISEINNLATYGISFSCKKGLKSNPNNQDDFSIIFEKKTLLISIFDGHGIHGSEISHYLHISLPNMILSHQKFPKELDLILSESFFNCNILLHQYCESRQISSEFSGSTCTIIIITGNMIISANVGDSRAIYEDSNGNIIELTANHKPNIPTENQRISISGGEVRLSPTETHPRIFSKGQHLPGISISRAFGDSLAQSIGVIVEPNIIKRKIESDDKFIVAGSDGIWEFMKDNDIIEIIHNEKHPAKSLAEASWTKWIENEVDAVDDITAIVVNLQDFNKYLESVND